jgi:hypothetical protein
MLLSKKHYSSWREIQDEYESFMTSLGPYTEQDWWISCRNSMGVTTRGGASRV